MHKRTLWPCVVVGMLATFAGVGLSRFAYSPLLPAVIEAGWFSSEQAAYVGAANLLGYLLGALLAPYAATRVGIRRVLSWALALIALTFALCAAPWPFPWFFSFRLISGLAGGLLMVLGPAFALAHLPPTQRPQWAPLVFTGIGLGALVAATLVPLLLAWPLAWSWSALAALSALAWLALSLLLPKLTAAPSPASTHPAPASTHGPIALLLIAYALDGAGFIPHTVFWADFLAREAALGTTVAAKQWAIFALGAICGPFIAAWAAKHLGSFKALFGAYLLKACAILLPLVSLGAISISLSSFCVGALTPAIVALTATCLAARRPLSAQPKVWGYATALFALSQAGSGVLMALIYSHSQRYLPLFAIGASCLLVGAVLVFFTLKKRKTHAALP